MHIHLLGTSAGKPIPRPFCTCHVCRAALCEGGKEVRTRTGVQFYPLDDFLETAGPVYQVDISPDYVHQIIRDKIDPSGLQHLLITHPDADHLHVEYLKFRSTVLSPSEELPVLHVYGNELVEEKIRSVIPDLEAVRCAFHRVEDGETFAVGAFQVTAFRAMHRGPRCLHYAVDDGQCKALFAWDGMWEEAVWERLGEWRFDAIGMECTHLGPSERDSSSHLTLRQFLRTRDRLVDLGVMDEATRLFALHIGDNGGLTCSEAEALAEREGFIVGYDGMRLTLGR